MRGRGLILVTLCLAALIINLDTTIVNVALPALVRQTGATTTDLQWVVDAYNLVFAALLLAAGSLSDRLGRKGMLLAGLGCPPGCPAGPSPPPKDLSAAPQPPPGSSAAPHWPAPDAASPTQRRPRSCTASPAPAWSPLGSPLSASCSWHSGSPPAHVTSKPTPGQPRAPHRKPTARQAGDHPGGAHDPQHPWLPSRRRRPGGQAGPRDYGSLSHSLSRANDPNAGLPAGW
jgi:hypothetical protein